MINIANEGRRINWRPDHHHRTAVACWYIKPIISHRRMIQAVVIQLPEASYRRRKNCAARSRLTLAGEEELHEGSTLELE